LTNATRYLSIVFHILLHFHFICWTLCNSHLPEIHISRKSNTYELLSLHWPWHIIAPNSVAWNRHGTLVSNFGDPSRLAFHNLIDGTSIGFQRWYVGEILYFITCHLDESIKKLNICISVCPTKVSRPSFKQPKTQDLKSRISLIN